MSEPIRKYRPGNKPPVVIEGVWADLQPQHCDCAKCGKRIKSEQDGVGPFLGCRFYHRACAPAARGTP